MLSLNNRFLKQIFSSFLDLAPILAVVLVFQVAVVQQPIPNVVDLIVGSLFVVIGLTFFILGLEQSLFPIGESMAYAFARQGNLFWLLAFSFSLGFGTAIAEPTLIAVANEAANIAGTGNIIEDTAKAKTSYALSLRLTVAFSIGLSILLGILRIIKGWPLYYLVLGGYFIVLVITPFAPASIVGFAYDAGSVATSAITVPLVTALGVGLASSIKGRNPMTDGFGLIALASLGPIIFVLFFGMMA